MYRQSLRLAHRLDELMRGWSDHVGLTNGAI